MWIGNVANTNFPIHTILIRKNKEKIELFDKINLNKTVFIENILHLFSNNSKVLKIEESFRNMLAMKGVKYIFKRDFFWRTWRQVENNGRLTVVCSGVKITGMASVKTVDIGGHLTILPDLIVFIIINSTNHIFYSRVMKNGFKNYVCDCGIIDPKTNLISRKEHPYRLDLFKKK
nr:uncharacterized protein LOC117994894 [Maniola hyperantus]